MGREIFYCANCGARILPEDFESGEAIALNNQNYCANCKASVAPELPAPSPAAPPPSTDMATGSSALRRVVRAPLPTMTSGRGGTGTVSRHQTTTPPRVTNVGRGGMQAGYPGTGGAKPNTVVYIAVGAGIVVILLLFALLSGGRKGGPTSGGGGSSGGGSGQTKTPPPEQVKVPPPEKEEFDRLKVEVYDFLRNNRKAEARSRIDAYRNRFPGYDTEKLDKLTQEIDVW
jgi:hypothetical protein